MIDLRIRVEPEYMDFFKALVKENYGKNVQEVVIKLLDTTIRRKFGIDDLRKWPYYEKTKTIKTVFKPNKCLSPAAPKKNEKKPIPKENTISENEKVHKTETPDNIPTRMKSNSIRSQIINSTNSRPKEEDPDLFTEETKQKLVGTVQHILDYPSSPNWDRLGRILRKNKELFPDEEYHYLKSDLEMGYEKYIDEKISKNLMPIKFRKIKRIN